MNMRQRALASYGDVKVTTGVFTFVALDDDFRPRELPVRG